MGEHNLHLDTKHTYMYTEIILEDDAKNLRIQGQLLAIIN